VTCGDRKKSSACRSQICPRSFLRQTVTLTKSAAVALRPSIEFIGRHPLHDCCREPSNIFSNLETSMGYH
jgi:hypothetical protein